MKSNRTLLYLASKGMELRAGGVGGPQKVGSFLVCLTWKGLPNFFYIA